MLFIYLYNLYSIYFLGVNQIGCIHCKVQAPRFQMTPILCWSRHFGHRLKVSFHYFFGTTDSSQIKSIIWRPLSGCITSALWSLRTSFPFSDPHWLNLTLKYVKNWCKQMGEQAALWIMIFISIGFCYGWMPVWLLCY